MAGEDEARAGRVKPRRHEVIRNVIRQRWGGGGTKYIGRLELVTD